MRQHILLFIALVTGLFQFAVPDVHAQSLSTAAPERSDFPANGSPGLPKCSATRSIKADCPAQ